MMNSLRLVSRFPPHIPRKQRGIAILTAVAVAALVASIATFMAFRENLWLRQVENQHDLAQAQLVAQSAIDFTRLTLQEDGRLTNVDTPLEEWNVPITNLPVEQGSAGGKLSDVQGRFNINNLVINGVSPSDADIETFKRLLGILGLSADNVPSLVDWMAASSDPIVPGGADDQYYLSLPQPIRPAHRQLADLSELAMIKGFDAEIVKRLTPYVVALPQRTSINVNFASSQVLRAYLPGLDDTSAQTLIDNIKRTPFNSPAEFQNALPEKVREQIPQNNTMGVVTQYFYSDVDAHFGRVNVSYRALIERLSNDTPPRVVWLRRR